MTAWPHETVLKAEAVAALAPADGEVHVDCTLGMGGHAEALLSAARCRVIGLDRDPEALRIASERLAPFGDRFTAVHARFSELSSVLASLDQPQVDGILADLGVSSLQLDEARRGFSFQRAGPVDMRMDGATGEGAAALIARLDEAGLVHILSAWGEERYARRIARAILANQPFEDTRALARVIEEAVPPPARRGPIHPATRSFQALRIAVNAELDEVDRLLPQAVDALRPGGRIAIIAFHSLEDRRVKRFFAEASGKDTPRDGYGDPLVPPRLRAARKPVTPSPDDPNPRARSARMRTAVRLP